MGPQPLDFGEPPRKIQSHEDLSEPSLDLRDSAGRYRHQNPEPCGGSGFSRFGGGQNLKIQSGFFGRPRSRLQSNLSDFKIQLDSMMLHYCPLDPLHF